MSSLYKALRREARRKVIPERVFDARRPGGAPVGSRKKAELEAKVRKEFEKRGWQFVRTGYTVVG